MRSECGTLNGGLQVFVISKCLCVDFGLVLRKKRREEILIMSSIFHTIDQDARSSVLSPLLLSIAS